MITTRIRITKTKEIGGLLRVAGTELDETVNNARQFVRQGFAEFVAVQKAGVAEDPSKRYRKRKTEDNDKETEL